MSPEAALVALGRALQAAGYDFTTVSPETHRRVLSRDRRLGTTPRDIFGWSRPFHRDALPTAWLAWLRDADALEVTGEGHEAGAPLLRSRVRFSSLHGGLYVHSAYPTTDALAVFFGPDTYRFCRAIGRDARPARRVVDIGCGSGAGGLIAGKGAARVVLADVNDAALVCSRVNAALAGVHHAETVRSDIFASVDGQFDRIVANPPYMLDASRRVYRDGGGRFGEEISLRIVREASERLAPGGTLLLYTGTAVIEGRDTFLDAAAPMLQELGMPFRYEEIDPDVFGEELERPGYAAVDRIAAVLLTLSRRK
jgi:methylase of polypeptide subunit release factors